MNRTAQIAALSFTSLAMLAAGTEARGHGSEGHNRSPVSTSSLRAPAPCGPPVWPADGLAAGRRRRPGVAQQRRRAPCVRSAFNGYFQSRKAEPGADRDPRVATWPRTAGWTSPAQSPALRRARSVDQRALPLGSVFYAQTAQASTSTSSTPASARTSLRRPRRSRFLDQHDRRLRDRGLPPTRHVRSGGGGRYLSDKGPRCTRCRRQLLGAHRSQHHGRHRLVSSLYPAPKGNKRAGAATVINIA
jgi:hypothetical protein